MGGNAAVLHKEEQPLLRVLFACEGNIGRSQMAEAMFNKLASGKAIAESAGVANIAVNLSGELLKDVAREVVECVSETGSDISNNKIKPISKEMFDRADVVVFMVNDLSHIPEYACSSSKTRMWDVDDLKHFTYGELCMGRDAILTRIVGLVNELEVTNLMRR